MVSEQDIYYEKLSHLNPAKASGPDGIPNWISVFGDNSFMNYAAPVFHYLRGGGKNWTLFERGLYRGFMVVNFAFTTL